MDVPKIGQPEGKDLIETLVTLTGLPEPLVNNELDQILEHAGQQDGKENLTLEELRAAMLTYLEALQDSCDDIAD